MLKHSTLNIKLHSISKPLNTIISQGTCIDVIGFQGKAFFDDLVGFMTSGPIYALKLEKVDAINSWRSLMGPSNFETAQEEAPDSLRATFGFNTTQNAVHGSDSPDSAVRELDFFFNGQHTPTLVHTDTVSVPKVDIESEGFIVVQREWHNEWQSDQEIRNMLDRTRCVAEILGI